MQLLAYGITYNEAFASGMINSPRTLLITPTTAEVLAKGGYTKRTLIDDLVETARKPTYEWTFSKVYGSYGRIFRSFDTGAPKGAQRSARSEREIAALVSESSGMGRHHNDSIHRA